MSTITSTQSAPVAEPAWDIARLFPTQGDWSEAEYLALNTNRLVELSDGCVEVLPLATEEHQEIVAFFYNRLYAFTEANRLGKVLFAPMPVAAERSDGACFGGPYLCGREPISSG
jgi:Uma2 family endonuclease